MIFVSAGSHGRLVRYSGLGTFVLAMLIGCSNSGPDLSVAEDAVEGSKADASSVGRAVNPEIWPKQQSPVKRDPVIEEKIARLLERMTLAEKVGQVIQADIASVTPAEVQQYHLGSVLNGGNSAPGNDNRTAAADWLALADEFWLASTNTDDGGAGIPSIWGTDAVHGHSNILGATIFPHNIGLGAANDPDMMYQIGRATAIEMLATGLDWTFAPTIAVVRDDRWGRTYESYSEDPAIVKAYTSRLIEGIQGKVGTPSYFDQDHLLATAKHFIGDGGTVGGKDQGDNITSEEELRDIQGAGYPVAIASGVQVVMTSFNSWHGRKMHGYKELIDDVLVDQMGLDGFVVGDWNGHGQVAGCTNVSCPTAFNNGLDMFMAPDSWKALYHNTLAQVNAGEISISRLNEAVSRILRIKFRVGLFDAGLPSTRKHAGNFKLLAAPEHRALARKAVRKSLVLLKNNDNILPLSPTQTILVTGDAADNIGKQSGGWTLTWQGRGNNNKHFEQGTSIYQGIKQRVSAGGGKVTLSANGDYTARPDVAVVVFGEEPYAEFEGDRQHLDFESTHGLELLTRYRKAGIPTVAVFISGRAMWINPEMNASDAFVAAWLPGTEGGGIADVLIRDPDERVEYDFHGKLSFSWPKTGSQTTVNKGDSDYAPLFPFGYGLNYSDKTNVAKLSEDPALTQDMTVAEDNFLRTGDPVPPWRLVIRDPGGSVQVTNSRAVTPTGALAVSPLDVNAQEDSSLFVWTGAARFSIEGEAVDLTRAEDDKRALEIFYKVDGDSVGSTVFKMGCGKNCAGALDVTGQLEGKLNRGWQTARIKLSCFASVTTDFNGAHVPFEVDASGPLNLQLKSVKLVDQPGEGCSL